MLDRYIAFVVRDGMAIKVRKPKGSMLIEMPVVTDLFAVSFKDHDLYGCTHCGFQSGTQTRSAQGTTIWNCGDCNALNIILFHGLTVSSYGFGLRSQTPLFPVRREHPRKGTPKRGRVDSMPEGGWEWFRPTGVGFSMTPGCFVCGGRLSLHFAINALVSCEEAGKRVTALFHTGAVLDYRPSDPDNVKVMVGACKTHRPNLEALRLSVRGNGIISPQKIEDSRA